MYCQTCGNHGTYDGCPTCGKVKKKRFFMSVVGLGKGSGISRLLNGGKQFWGRIFYTHSTGYFLDGYYGETAKVSKEEGRLYMKGLASPTWVI